MKLLLDTHILLWALTGDKKLPEEADKMINSADNVIFYSIISVWETAIKHMRHPEQLAVTPHELEKYCRRAKMKNLVLNLAHVYTLETLTRPDNVPPHKDPFDRMLISQAKSEGMTFITHDDRLTAYNEPCILYV